MSITSTLVHRADIRFHEAAEALQPYVGCFWVVTAERRAAIRIVPDGSTSISILLRRGRASRWLLRGPLVRPDELRFASSATLVGVRLRPGVAFTLTGIPAHATVGRRVALTSGPFRELVARDGALQTPEQHIDALQRLLLERLQHTRVHAAVATAVQEIEREHGLSKVTDIAARCRVSPRHLNRLMRLWVGYGPKSFATVVRFQATLKDIDRAPAQPAARLASENGYFDQAHMAVAVRRLAGDTPRRLATTAVSDFSKTRCEDAL
jgi:AraC-like DNA-binding protein